MNGGEIVEAWYVDSEGMVFWPDEINLAEARRQGYEPQKVLIRKPAPTPTEQDSEARADWPDYLPRNPDECQSCGEPLPCADCDPAPEDTPASVGEADPVPDSEKVRVYQPSETPPGPTVGWPDYCRLTERVEEAEAAMVKARRQRDDYGSAQGVEAALRMEAEQEAQAYREALERIAANPWAQPATVARTALDPTPIATTEEDR